MAIKRVFTTTEKELVTNENQTALNENLTLAALYVFDRPQYNEIVARILVYKHHCSK